MEVLGAFDGVLYYECAKCNARWHRFPVGHALRDVASKYMQHRPTHTPSFP